MLVPSSLRRVDKSDPRLGPSPKLCRNIVAARGQSIPPASPTLYVPTDVAERMLELAGVTKDDVVYDLGCGDGRIAIAAAKKYGTRAVGVDSGPDRIA